MPLSESEQHVCRTIDARADALLEDLRLHVGIPTGNGNATGLDETRALLTARLERLGAATQLIPGDAKPDWLIESGSRSEIPPTAVCGRDGSSLSLQRILIAGHLDTVHEPASDFRELNIAADGKSAIGPGCVDMKGGLVIAVAALEALEESGLDVSWTFLMNSDEESGTFHSASALREQAKHHDFGLALEPALAGGELAIERLGSGQFMLEARGRSAHVGRSFTEGISADAANRVAL